MRPCGSSFVLPGRDVRAEVNDADATARPGLPPVGAANSSHGPTSADVLARLAGYDPKELDGLPAEAVKGASGCGTPVAFSDLLPGEVVLVLGSGTGLDLLLAARQVGPAGRVIGVDWDEVSVGRARNNAATAGFGNVEVRALLGEEFPVADGSVDWLLCNRTISRCPDKAKVFAEIHRVVKPGGRVCLADIVVEHLPEGARAGGPRALAWMAGAMSEDDYIAALAGAGLEDVRDGGRYVYSVAELSALAPLFGGGQGDTTNDLAGQAVGAVWSAYFFARRPLPEEEDGRQYEKEESR